MQKSPSEDPIKQKLAPEQNASRRVQSQKYDTNEIRNEFDQARQTPTVVVDPKRAGANVQNLREKLGSLPIGMAMSGMPPPGGAKRGGPAAGGGAPRRVPGKAADLISKCLLSYFLWST